MQWLDSVNKALRVIEERLTDEISCDDIAREVNYSETHFQRVFSLVTGYTVGEYMRNRRLSIAGQELKSGKLKVIDAAMKFGYDTSESFSKAFSRFHGISPSEAKQDGEKLKYFYPLYINVSLNGGFTMPEKFKDGFCWNNIGSGNANDPEKEYHIITEWAGKARSQNPCVFDELTEWILDDSEWTEDKLRENEQILMNGVLGRFRKQNAELRASLNSLAKTGVVNKAVFGALDRFDDALSGRTFDDRLSEVAVQVFADFSKMLNPEVRKLFAGNKTGASGTDTVEVFGYVNCLKECDASVQWALFMPEYAKKQQNGFSVESFEYRKLPAVRFIGKECEPTAGEGEKKAIFDTLDGMKEYCSGFDYDILFSHFYGKGVDVEPWHGFFGRLMKAGAPIPEGFIGVDFLPQNDGNFGTPYISQFAFAIFSGGSAAIHKMEGYNGGAMYDVTRNIILGQNVRIPYPEKYWTAEVFLNGWEKESSAYMFSVEL